MSAIQVPRIGAEEYLRREGPAAFRSEYCRGRIVAMAGASPTHNLIVGNLIYALNAQLRTRPCRVYANDQRVSVGAGLGYYYPDVVVTCGRQIFDEDQKDTLVNPIVIIEVLSKSTEAFDRVEKFHDYLSIPSLRGYVLVNQTPRRFEIYQRQDDNSWRYESWPFSPPPFVLQSIDCTLVPEDVYLKVENDEAGGGET